MEPKVRAKIGLLPTGHHYYWDQYPRLKEMGQGMYAKLRDMLSQYADVVAPELVDTPEKARQAGEMFQGEAVDMVVVFPFGYTPSMDMIPAVANLSVPIRLLNAHENHTYDFTSADTTVYLHHEGVCCIPAPMLLQNTVNHKVFHRFGGKLALW